LGRAVSCGSADKGQPEAAAIHCGPGHVPVVFPFAAGRGGTGIVGNLIDGAEVHKLLKQRLLGVWGQLGSQLCHGVGPLRGGNPRSAVVEPRAVGLAGWRESLIDRFWDRLLPIDDALAPPVGELIRCMKMVANVP
jgi:hypothetical protein